ncbi:MAG: TonB-dependent receptor [Bacteroidota bacterium]|nr:TonB-dependent receptor [Bacteroidota bacterium]
MKKLLTLIAVFASFTMWAQTQVSGTVTDADGQPLPGANIVLDGTTGAVSDFDGNFSLSTDQQPPFTLTVSSVGFVSKTVDVTSASGALTIQLSEGSTQLDEIVVSASRMAERIFESPVTVEKFSLQKIQNTPSADYFNGLANLKGVSLVEAGLVFNQVQIRGFSDIYNEGLVTLVDGMNNQMPVFGFAVGNLIGLNELDVQSIELVPGAASALYGADAYKGILFLNSKNPFDHQGISVKIKQGITEQDTAGQNDFTEISVRMATQLSDKLAIKASLSHKEGTDWSAQDYRHSVDGVIIDNYAANSPDYNAVNEEGEITFSTPLIWDQLAGVAGNSAISGFTNYSPNYFGTILSSGFNDVDMFGSETSNTKANLAIHYRPNENSEISLQSLIGTGTAPLSTGGTRYHLDDVQIEQHKLEYKSGGLTSRIYFTKEDAGETLVAQLMSIALQQRSTYPQADGSVATGIQSGWGLTYLKTYLGALAGAKGYITDPTNPLSVLNGVGLLIGDFQNHIFGNATPNPDPTTAPIVPYLPNEATAALTIDDLFGGPGSTQAAHNAARAAADAGMLKPGTSEYQAAFNEISNISANNLGAGAKIVDVSKIYNYEIDYDFEDKLSVGQLIVGANLRQYNLNTQGTLYTDYDKPIEYQEYGAYAQLKRNIFDDKVTLTGSLRYDKQTVLEEGNITPRLGLLFNLSENQNIRFSAQQGFRNPTNQDKFIGYNQGTYTILGSSRDNIERFSQTLPLRNSVRDANGNHQNLHTFTGEEVLGNGYDIFSGVAVDLDYVKPEVVTMFELGYRYNISDLTLDISAYFSNYQDKIAGKYVNVPVLTNNNGTTYADAAAAIAADNYYGFQVDSNLDEEFNAYGVSLEATKSFSNNLSANLVYEYNQKDYEENSSVTSFVSWNTPDHRVKGGLNYTNGLFSLNTNVRYNSAYYYESSFFSADIDSNTVIDAKASFALPALNATLEIGGNNIGGDNYVSLPGSGLIGSVYYTGLRIDI